MKYNIGDTFLVECIKEFPEDDYLTYTKYCHYQVKVYQDKDGKVWFDVPDDILGGIGSGLSEKEFNDHFRKLTKKELNRW